MLAVKKIQIPLSVEQVSDLKDKELEDAYAWAYLVDTINTQQDMEIHTFIVEHVLPTIIYDGPGTDTLYHEVQQRAENEDEIEEVVQRVTGKASQMIEEMFAKGVKADIATSRQRQIAAEDLSGLDNKALEDAYLSACLAGTLGEVKQIKVGMLMVDNSLPAIPYSGPTMDEIYSEIHQRYSEKEIVEMMDRVTKQLDERIGDMFAEGVKSSVDRVISNTRTGPGGFGTVIVNRKEQPVTAEDLPNIDDGALFDLAVKSYKAHILNPKNDIIIGDDSIPNNFPPVIDIEPVFSDIEYEYMRRTAERRGHDFLSDELRYELEDDPEVEEFITKYEKEASKQVGTMLGEALKQYQIRGLVNNQSAGFGR